MSKFNTKKVSEPFGIGQIAGVTTDAAGKYTNYELLRRVTLANLLFEKLAYQSGDTITGQIEKLVPLVEPSKIVELAIECRTKQNLRHMPLWLLLLVNEYHKGYPVADAVAKVCTRPDMLMDLLGMIQKRKGSISLKGLKGIKKGMAKAFDNYNGYQIAKYRKENMEIKLVDVVNLVHPKPTQKNETALKELVAGTIKSADTWETNLTSGKNKKDTFVRLIEENKLGSLAILRNIRNFKDCGMDRKQIKKALSQVSSTLLTPLNFLAAQRVAPEFTEDINEAMKNCFAGYKISGTTILAIDVSGSMGSVTSKFSDFDRLDLAVAMAALGSYIFEDLILVFTAGNDGSRKGMHVVHDNSKGLGVFNDISAIRSKIGHGGIFTTQLCEWLKTEGYAKDADRLVVISDSQDIDAMNGTKVKPDTTPYKNSYIIDISSHTHGIKTSAWTAEISGWSDGVFRYIAALENLNTKTDGTDDDAE